MIVVQAKWVQSTESSAFARNVYKAIGQLRGEYGETPPVDSVRVAVIGLNPAHELYDKPKAKLIEALRHSPSEFEDLKSFDSARAHGWERIEVRGSSKIVIIPGDL